MLFDRIKKVLHDVKEVLGQLGPGGAALLILGLMGFAPVVVGTLYFACVAAFKVARVVISAIDGLLSPLFSDTFSICSLVFGILIGLILYRRIENRKTRSANARQAWTAVPNPEEEVYTSEAYRHCGS